MDEYIKRDTVLRCIKEARENIDWGQSEDEDAFLHYSACLYRTIASAECIPAADVVERKTGKWIHDVLGELKMPVVKCSECGLIEPWFEVEGMGFALHGEKYANYCPNCGTKMEGGDADV